MFRIYLKFKSQYLKTAMEYKLNFWLMFFAGVLMQTVFVGVAYVLYQNVPDIAGWLEGEVYLIMAFMFITEGLCGLLFEGAWRIPSLVFSGEFDVMLTRPISPLYQIISHDIGLHSIGTLTVGVISLIMAIMSLGWASPLTFALCTIIIVCGTVVRLSVYIIANSNVFWLKAGGNTNIPYLVTTIGEYAKYPVGIYPIWMQVILHFVIPFAMIGYIPALLFRGENVLLNASLLACVTVLIFLLARFVFYRGIRKYESAGM